MHSKIFFGNIIIILFLELLFTSNIVFNSLDNQNSAFHGVRVAPKLLQRKARDAVLLCQEWQHTCYPLRRSLPDEMILKIISFLIPSPALCMEQIDELGKTPIEIACESSQKVPEDNTEFLRGVNQVCELYQKFQDDWMTFLPGRQNSSDDFTLDPRKMNFKELKDIPFKMRNEITSVYAENSNESLPPTYFVEWVNDNM